MSKKRGKNRKKQVAPKPTPVIPPSGLTRRDIVIGAGVTVAATAVGNEISKYLPGPVQTVAVAPATNPPRTVSLGILWGKPTTPPQGTEGVPNQIASGKGSVTEG
jgi:hypothetical protein